MVKEAEVIEIDFTKVERLKVPKKEKDIFEVVTKANKLKEKKTAKERKRENNKILKDYRIKN